jgi:hypothetical protein
MYFHTGTLVGHLCRNCLRSLCRKVPFGRGPLDPGSGGGRGGRRQPFGLTMQPLASHWWIGTEIFMPASPPRARDNRAEYSTLPSPYGLYVA